MIGLDELNILLRQQLVFLALPIVYFGECLSLVLVVLIRWLGMRLITLQLGQSCHWITLYSTTEAKQACGQHQDWGRFGSSLMHFWVRDGNHELNQWHKRDLKSLDMELLSHGWKEAREEKGMGKRPDNSFWWNHWVPDASHILRCLKSEYIFLLFKNNFEWYQNSIEMNNVTNYWGKSD